MLGEAIPVLDDGFVRVVDYMGDDSAIVQAARTSYGKGTKRRHEDRGLLRYLMRHAHTTPFEMCEIKLHVRVPMDVWRQWIRHRTASVNEYSTRYSEAIDAAQRTAPGAWRLQSTGNRQGSSGLLPRGPGHAAVGGGRPAAAAGAGHLRRAARGRRRPRAGAKGPAAVHLHRGVLEDRPPEPAALPGTADGRARAAGDPRVRQRHRRARSWRRGCRSPGRRFSTTGGAGRGCRASRARFWRRSPRATANARSRMADEGGFLSRGDDGRLKPNLEGRELEEKLERLGLQPPWE